MTYTSVLSALQLNRVGAQLDVLKKTQSNGRLLRTKARSVQTIFGFSKRDYGVIIWHFILVPYMSIKTLANMFTLLTNDVKCKTDISLFSDGRRDDIRL